MSGKSSYWEVFWWSKKQGRVKGEPEMRRTRFIATSAVSGVDAVRNPKGKWLFTDNLKEKEGEGNGLIRWDAVMMYPRHFGDSVLQRRGPVWWWIWESSNGLLLHGVHAATMKRLQDQGASCFVLDLRDNFGGLVEAGIEIAKLFLDKGDTVIYTVGRGESQDAIVTDSTPVVTVPVMVLVNHNTASASEIVASALHDNCKAVLVGEKTFGKGLIQSVFELQDGSGVVVTVGKYVTPGHFDINGNGIEPDFSNIPRWSEVMKHLSTCNQLRQG